MDPSEQLDGVGMIPAQVPLVDRLVMSCAVAHVMELLQPAFHFVAPHAEIGWAVREGSVEIRHPERGVVPRLNQVPPEAEGQLRHHATVHLIAAALAGRPRSRFREVGTPLTVKWNRIEPLPPFPVAFLPTRAVRGRERSE
ncbi:hypothetical protein [Curtobacterium flaccumfaciens]|uniref:hypothetical protein n=1 Tax=Curtobacterium flaccumfaciens TaxID=2035 RepID=UPI0010612C8A|nr:hypothetical protein [Curtobacterium flaccumfaciens]